MSKSLTPDVETLNLDDHTVVQKNPKKKWQSYIWDTFDKSPEERHFIFKLDLALLTFGCLGMNLWHVRDLRDADFRDRLFRQVP